MNAIQSPGEAPLYPTQLYCVALDNITHRVSPEPFDRSDAGRVVGGNWDRHKTHLTQGDSLYQGLQDRYERGIPWEQTDFFIRQKERINNGEKAWGRSTLAELHRRYQRLDDVYKSMKTEGYLPARDRVKGRRIEALDEIAVHVSRDGELLFAGEGNHRIRLAKLLDLDTVVVQILVRHSDWQETRDRIAAGETSIKEVDISLKHPDLRELV